MNNLWENDKIRNEIIDLYFNKKLKSNKIFEIILEKNKDNISNTKIRKDIGRIIHRYSENIKFNNNIPIGKCPICGKEVFLRNKVKQKEKFCCICSGVFKNKCYFRLTKTSYGIPLYNSIIRQLLEKKHTELIYNLKYKGEKVNSYLYIDLYKKGFINIGIV